MSRDLPFEDFIEDASQARSRRGTTASSSYAGVDGNRSGTPEPWVKRLADDGLTFFYENTTTGEMRWTPPSPGLPSRKPLPPKAVKEAPAISINGSNGMEQSLAPPPNSRGRPDSGSVFTQALLDQRLRAPDSDIDADQYLNRLSVYSDDSEVKPFSPQAAHFSTLDQFPAIPVPPTLLADQKHALELQQQLPSPSEPTLAELSSAAEAAVREVVSATQAVAGASSEELGPTTTVLSENVSNVVVAIRKLLTAFTSTPIPATPRTTTEQAQPELLPVQLRRPRQRVAATLSKLVLSTREVSASLDTSAPEALARVQNETTDLQVAINAFGSEVQKVTSGPGRRSSGILVGGDVLAGLGLGSMGAGAAGGWKGFGFVPSDRYPPKPLDQELLAELRKWAGRVEEHLSLLDLSPPEVDPSMPRPGKPTFARLGPRLSQI